ncbi:MAG TPA: hypothetical protein VFN96_04900 [Gemmatimonadales bacterium]|nr:hypothetical protein [Gemmatimonadales bacterium]
MTKILGLLAGLVLLPVSVRAQTGLTIYQDGRVMVRRTVDLAVPAGTSTHRLALGRLEPSTLFALDSGVAVMGASYDEAVDERNTMRRAVGRTIWFRTGSRSANVWDTLSAIVVGVDPERFRLADGRIVFQRPGLPLYPTELVLVDPTLAVGLRSARALPSLRLGYFTDGASWTASYGVILGRGGARVTGSAAIPSATLRVADAEVQLLAGSVGQAKQPRPPMPYAAQAMRLEELVVTDAAAEQQVGEARLYTLPGRLTLEPGVTTSAALFEPSSAPWERSFIVRGQMPYWGPVPQTGDQEGRVPVEVQYTLTRRPRTPFGDLPLPAGTWRLYQPDDAGRLQLIGEASAGHTAPGQEIRLSAGTAFDLTANRVQTIYQTRRDSLRTIATMEFRVTIASAKDSASVVDVLEERAGEWSVVSSSVPAERLSSTRTRFRVRVPARGEAQLTYRLRVVW